MTNLANIDSTGALEKAQIDIQIATAKSYPRNVQLAIQQAIAICTSSQETAELCFYCLFRKSRNEKGVEEKKEIKGPSIRLAEVLANCWGNFHAGTRIIGKDHKSVIVEGVAWDLEKNVRMSQQVERSILTKTGQTYSADMQVMTINAASSIALRNAIFRVIGKAVVDEIYRAAVKRAVSAEPGKTVAQKIDSCIKRFKAFGIPETRILTFFEKKSVAELTEEDLENMIGIGTSLAEKQITPQQAFILLDESDDDTAERKINSLIEDKRS